MEFDGNIDLCRELVFDHGCVGWAYLAWSSNFVGTWCSHVASVDLFVVSAARRECVVDLLESRDHGVLVDL